MVDFRTIRIADLGRVVTGKTPPSAQPELFGDAHPFLTPTDIDGFARHIEPNRFLSAAGRDYQHRLMLPSRAVCVVCIGATIGKVCMTDRPSFTNQQINSVVVNEAEHDPFFVYHLLTTLRDELKSNAGGAATPIINKTAFSEIAISVPPLPVQQRIAGILSAYDELIENSQRRIKILESMAHALYREWFVHFRFPGHENHPRVTSPLGEIPLGWGVKTVKDILARRAAGSVYRDSDVKPEGDIPVIDQSTKEILGFHDNAPDHNASSALPMAIFGDHTCKMQLLIEPFSVGPNVVPFLANQEMPTAYVFYAVNSLVHTQEYKRHWIPLTAKEVVVADRVTAQRFASLIQPMLVTQETHRKAIRNIRRTRDLLLSRLLSGQIEVEAA